MLKLLVKIVGAVVVVVGTIGVVFVVGMRTKSPTVLTAVRRMNRTFWNPRAMQTAGTPGAYASVVRHVGRRSGTAYETPVGTVATDDGFVITLPYGSEADWLKNVLARGAATIVAEGETHDVDRPEVVPTAEVLTLFPPDERRTLRVFGVDQCLRVHRVETGGGPAAANDRG